MEVEWENPVIWGITIFATLVVAISIWKYGASIGWDGIPMVTRILITVCTPVVSFFVAQAVANK